MLNTLRHLWSRVRSAWYPMSQAPTGFFRPEYNLALPGRLAGRDQALSLSPFFAALRKYQTAFASLPLVTYTKGPDGSRDRLQDKATFNILHERPNPAQSRAAFFEQLLLDYWIEGECFIHLRWANNHRLTGLYPIRARDVVRVEFDDEWRKTYHVSGEADPFMDDEVCHVIHFSKDGLRGVPFLHYAGESLGLHKQILDTATSLYENTARVQGQITQTVQMSKEARAELKADFGENFQGVLNAGRLPFMPLGTKIEPIDTRSAESAQLIEALNIGCADIGRWFDNMSPLLIGDLSRGTYSNSAADKLAFYQCNLLPLLQKFELELNYKLFGAGADTYCEFLTDNVLRADPKTQADVWHLGLQDGYLLKSEVRSWLNLPAVEGMDVPQTALNMGPVPSVQVEPVQEVAGEDTPATAIV